MQKQLEGTEVYNDSADRVALIDGQLMQHCDNTRGNGIKPKVIKPSNPFTNVCWFCFNNIFCAATNFGCIDSFLLLNSETKK